MTMAFGYAPQGLSRMSYCNQTPFPPREVWGLGTRLGMYICTCMIYTQLFLISLVTVCVRFAHIITIL